ncbi:hypothetical protein [Ureibacillus sinduriensis]|uniref:Uncharacterized protein n=1 Tax=Ureibacillus sinduriensis BLB-1 = JCM 15800 TaxID=1384057 RepID=A0A0A3IPY2_9BACL|nr:hypothetical protein [Ureibacillus sinduriensis]KGR76902.1 hypothetical protein CD33_04290 [Ureibacillus sinduriensis BLB-1 = JCM 15800]
MRSWRITKYNPLHRNADGSYVDLEEWICFSEVGTKVSMEDYEKTEEKYMNAVTTFMAGIGLSNVYVNASEQESHEVKNQHAQEFLSKIWKGKAVTAQEVRELAKLTLRNAIWCKLGFKKQFFVHIGYYYYMYIGASESCEKAREIVHRSGLFIEDYHSPYLKN